MNKLFTWGVRTLTKASKVREFQIRIIWCASKILCKCKKDTKKKFYYATAYLFQTQDGFEWYLSFLYQDKSHFYNRMFDKMIHTLISLHQEDRTLNSRVVMTVYFTSTSMRYHLKIKLLKKFTIFIFPPNAIFEVGLSTSMIEVWNWFIMLRKIFSCKPLFSLLPITKFWRQI